MVGVVWLKILRIYLKKYLHIIKINFKYNNYFIQLWCSDSAGYHSLDNEYLKRIDKPLSGTQVYKFIVKKIEPLNRPLSREVPFHTIF